MSASLLQRDDRARDLRGEVTLRWVLVHMIEETARHFGHLDRLREMLDGATGESRGRTSSIRPCWRSHFSWRGDGLAEGDLTSHGGETASRRESRPCPRGRMPATAL